MVLSMYFLSTTDVSVFFTYGGARLCSVCGVLCAEFRLVPLRIAVVFVGGGEWVSRGTGG